MSRGNVMRYNFIHNITEHSSPIKTHQVTGLYIDALNSGMTMEGNIFYRNTERAMYAHGPDNRIENNLFVENNVGISMADRSWLLDESRLSTLLIRSEEFFREFNYKQPPWSARYPRLAKVFEDRLPLGRTEKNNIERNVNAEGPFFTAHAVIKMEKNVMRNNWDEGTPLLVNPDKLDFRMRPGSPVYGATGHMPIPFKDIGVYRDPLRASWPVNRLPAGKYYKKEMISQPIPVSSANLFQPLKKVSETYQYNVIRRNAPVNIDGKLQKSEWSGMDKTRALFVGEHHITGERRDGAESYAWLSYDDNYLYIGIENSPDPVKPGVPAALSAPSPLNEIAIEGVLNQNTVSWWNDGLPTGPIYIFTGYSDGRLVINKKFNIPDAAVKQLEAEIEYKSEIIDPKEYHWTAEWKIPLAALELEVNNINLLRFNIGTPKRGGWYAWVATGSSIWRIDNAGFLKFIK